MSIPSRWVTVQSQSSYGVENFSFVVDEIVLLKLSCTVPRKGLLPSYELKVILKDSSSLCFQYFGADAKEKSEASRDLILNKMAEWEQHIAGRSASQPKHHCCYNPTIIYTTNSGNKRRRPLHLYNQSF